MKQGAKPGADDPVTSSDDASQRLGLALKAIRLNRGWSQEDLANQAGMSRRAVQRMEAGSAQMNTLVKTLVGLGCFDEVLEVLGKDIPKKIWRKVARSGRAPSPGGFSKQYRKIGVPPC